MIFICSTVSLNKYNEPYGIYQNDKEWVSQNSGKLLIFSRKKCHANVRGLLNYKLTKRRLTRDIKYLTLLQRSSYNFSNLLKITYTFYETPATGFRSCSIHLPSVLSSVLLYSSRDPNGKQCLNSPS